MAECRDGGMAGLGMVRGVLEGAMIGRNGVGMIGTQKNEKPL